MLPFNDMAVALNNVVRLIRLDGNAVNDFDLTPRGFWRSFYAALFVAPFSMMMSGARYFTIHDGIAGTGVSISIWRFTTVEAISFVIAWVAFPVVMATVVRFLDCERHYVRGVVAYNWAAVAQNAIYVPVAVINVLTDGSSMPTFLTLIAILSFGWYVAWKGFGITRPQAVMVVGIDLSIGLVISYWANRLVLP